MNKLESNQLTPGTPVIWEKNTADTGEVIKVTGTAVYIRWKSGQEGWIDHRDMGKVSRVK